MKIKLFLTNSILGLLASGVVCAACDSKHDEPEVIINPDDQPGESADKYGLVAKDVRSYFTSVVKGEEAEYTAPGDLSAEDVEGASQYVWKLWKAAVERNTTEYLPLLTSHYELSDWGDMKNPDAIWTLPEGKMNIFYGSKGSKPSAGYPLFLFLHGSGCDANGEWTTGLAWIKYFRDGSTAYFVPKSPQGGTGCRWYQPSRQEKWENMLRQALVSDNIDPDKIYFAGISEGAYGSHRLASFYADYLAGAGPIAGGEMLASCPPENLANVAFCLQTGELDESYGRKLLTEKVGTLLDGLEAAHPGYYTHKVDLQLGKGHGCDYTVTTPWLVNYSRKVNPKYVYWENFGMGGINNEEVRYRDAFYNLYIVEPSNDRTDDMSRAVYEMTIDGNVVNLTVRNVTVTPSESTSTVTSNVNVGVEKTYTNTTVGKIRIYLNNDLVDLSQPVIVMINGVEKFKGTLTPDTRNMVESCAIFYDPHRVYPAAVEVSVQ